MHSASRHFREPNTYPLNQKRCSGVLILYASKITTELPPFKINLDIGTQLQTKLEKSLFKCAGTSSWMGIPTQSKV